MTVCSDTEVAFGVMKSTQQNTSWFTWPVTTTHCGHVDDSLKVSLDTRCPLSMFRWQLINLSCTWIGRLIGFMSP